MQLFTPKGFVLAAVVSAMQKAIRRGDAKMAGYWACEMWRGGYDKYFWRRILIISAEDVHGCITAEVMALRAAYLVLNDYRKGDNRDGGGQLFVAKAAYLLARAQKSRDVDNLINLVVMDGLGVTDEELKADIAAAEGSGKLQDFDLPWYMWDYHTPKGKKAGETRETFIVKEDAALTPRAPGLFDHLVPLAGQRGPTADPVGAPGGVPIGPAALDASGKATAAPAKKAS